MPDEKTETMGEFHEDDFHELKAILSGYRGI